MFVRRALVLLPLLWLAPNAFAIDFSRYHTQDEINTYMQDLAHANPDLVTAAKLGTSEEGRDIWYVAITQADPVSAPAVFVNGTHHGDEWSSTESSLAFIDHLVQDRADPAVAELLKHFVVVVQPLVNPDGHAASTREDAEGRDPNRDYAFPERSDADSFEIPVISLVKGLVDRYHFQAAIALHSGEEAVLWPWCYTPTGSADNDVFYTLSKKAAAALSFRNVQQSYNDYPTDGEFIDYAYMSQKTFAVTFEVSNSKTPPARQLDATVKRAVNGMMAFFEAVEQYETGNLAVQQAPQTHGKSFNPVWVRLGKRVE